MEDQQDIEENTGNNINEMAESTEEATGVEKPSAPQPTEEPAETEESTSLIPIDEYLAAGVHIGTQQKTKDMLNFIYRVRTDGLYVLDIQSTEQRIKLAANFLSKYNSSKILVTSARQYGQHPATMFAKAIGAKSMVGRFIPGTLTNPQMEGFFEPEVTLVTDPIGDAQVIKESVNIGVPVIAFCDTNNQTSSVDLVVPTNNKGRKALSLVYWLLAKEVTKKKGIPFNYEFSDFETEI